MSLTNPSFVTLVRLDFHASKAVRTVRVFGVRSIAAWTSSGDPFHPQGQGHPCRAAPQVQGNGKDRYRQPVTLGKTLCFRIV